MCIRHFSYICNRDSHFRSSAKAQRSKNTIFTNNSKSPNTMRFFQFFTFEIIKSKKIFRRNLFEPENELPQLPTNNNYDEQFLSFFQQCFELVCPKKDGTANIYKAETMGKQEGFLLGRIADSWPLNGERLSAINRKGWPTSSRKRSAKNWPTPTCWTS